MCTMYEIYCSGMAPRIKIDSKLTYFELDFLKHVRRFDVLQDNVEADRNLSRFKKSAPK